ncbi:MAG: hypothetical protein IPP40_06695 [bacterium]|nr:hypothetical protein [bacterium]
MPDIGIGRLPTADFTQLSAMISKSINYEADPFMTDTTWFNRTWCAVHSGLYSVQSFRRNTRRSCSKGNKPRSRSRLSC